MNPDELARILDELGKRLGPAGQHVFELAVRQQYINALLGLIESGAVLLIGIPVILYCVRLTRRRWAADMARYANSNDHSSSKPDIDGYVFAWIVGGALALFVLGMAAVDFFASISILLNPEYAAIREILSAIGGTR